MKQVRVPKGVRARQSDQSGVIRQVCGYAMAVPGSICGLPESDHPCGHEYEAALVIKGVSNVRVQCEGQVTIDDALKAERRAESADGDDIEVVAGFSIAEAASGGYE